MGRLVDVDEVSKYVIIGNGDLRKIPTVEAIPKDQYEARLKADMLDILEELQLEIEDRVKEEELIDKTWASGLHYSEKIIQQKIDKLKGEENGNK